ncbi:poly(ADP-ribose) glycohydrolase domain-containing protein [Paenibacillus taichungensis]|uniref:poly(ADP-ribose) glycohydrolase domain-containing protein n=1 Tax=Paenibacillus taichungensis TaxID=484184 RepID=UPI002871026D|nr:poly(ADP-ribose) glycohydrolase domain-containing protein [Paenibacillus taichungensis]MDR9743938.1 DUF2263 domain-containing protein [Paenibacillus taichungensis]
MNDQQHKNNIQNNNRSKTTGFNSTNQRSRRSQIAHQTLAILEEGEYVNGYDRRVQIGTDLQRAIRDSVLYRPTELIALREKRSRNGSAATSRRSFSRSHRGYG